MESDQGSDQVQTLKYCTVYIIVMQRNTRIYEINGLMNIVILHVI